MFTLTLKKNSETPLYRQLYNYIKTEIESGSIKGGERLPSKRELASHLKISVVTVETAYSQLIAEGYIYSKAGSGFFAEDLFSEAVLIPEQKEEYYPAENYEYKYNFHTNRIDTAHFPFSVWAKLMREVLSEKSEELLDACPPQGNLKLRNAIAEYLKGFRGLEVSPGQIFIGAGSEYLTGLIIQLLGRDFAYGIENPGYKKTYKIYSSNAFRTFPVPMDEKGASVSSVVNFGIDVIHVTPSHHFPLGTIMPISRRQELLQWTGAKENRYIIEDDYDSEFRYDGGPIPSLFSMDKDERVIYINTFTKTLSPSIRISYMILPESLAKKFMDKLSFYSCTVPIFEQLALAKFIEKGHFSSHVSRMKKLYKNRRDIMIKRLGEGLLKDVVSIGGFGAGMHLLITVNNGMNQSELLSSAAKYGVKLHGLSEYYSFPVLNMPENTVIAGFSGIDERQIIKGVSMLEKAWMPGGDR